MSMVRKTYAEGRRKYKKRIIGQRNENDIALAETEKAERVRLRKLADAEAGHVSSARKVKIDPAAPGAKRRWL
jgi:hypothetical protein